MKNLSCLPLKEIIQIKNILIYCEGKAQKYVSYKLHFCGKDFRIKIITLLV